MNIHYAMTSVFLVAFAVVSVSAYNSRTFKAAIYDQNVPMDVDIPNYASRATALALMSPRLDEYRNMTRVAYYAGADIIVFPEYGVIPIPMNSSKLMAFLEPIVFPSTRVLCNRPRPGMEIQARLSCTARSYRMYVSAMIGERVPCYIGRHPGCPSDRMFHYHTNVVYNPDGQLVSRARKQNLFYTEDYFQAPPDSPSTMFETPFGMFGVVVSFDLLYKEPALKMIEYGGAHTLIFPTAWMNVLPYFSALGFHQSYAIGMGINLLAANLHIPDSRFLGSGAYTPGRQLTVSNRRSNNTSYLLLAELPIYPVNTTYTKPYVARGYTQLNATVFGDTYNFIEIHASSRTLSKNVCHGSLCCRIRYRTNGTLANNEKYFFGAFSGYHTLEGLYSLEVCLLMMCKGSIRSCSSPPDSARSTFSLLEVQGNFVGTPLPQLMTTNLNSPHDCFLWTGRKMMLLPRCNNRGIVSATVMARRYDLD